MTVGFDQLLAPEVETVRLHRSLAASCEAVFHAWTDPQEFLAWWQPSPYRTVAAEMDVQVGGAYRITMELPSGSRQFLFGTYLTVEPAKRLSMTWRLSGSEADDGYVAILTIELRESDAGTELVLVHERLHQSSLAMYSAGWLDVLARLVEHLR
jgi:uncharacterized protein YndB with AHSA1/START domain